MALLAVLAGVAAAVLATSSLLVSARAHRETDAVSQTHDHLRAALREALAEAAAQFSEQRPDLLAGETPELAAPLVVRELGGVTLVVRVASDDAGLPMLSPEADRANLNTMDAERLARMPGIDTATAQDIAALLPAFAPAQAGVPASLLPEFTTLTRDPPIASDATPRLRMSPGWTQQFRAEPPDTWTPPAREALLAVLPAPRPDEESSDEEETQEPSTLAEVFRLLDRADTPPRDTQEVLDRLESPAELAGVGRIDVSRADARVLATIAGFDELSAQEAVDRRATLDPAVLTSPLWLTSEGVLDSTAFAEAIDSICARTLQWRVVLEAGVLLESDDGAADLGGLSMLTYPLRLEAVFDLADEAPAITWLAHTTGEQPETEPVDALEAEDQDLLAADTPAPGASPRAPSPFDRPPPRASGRVDAESSGAEPEAGTPDAAAASRLRLIGASD